MRNGIFDNSSAVTFFLFKQAAQFPTLPFLFLRLAGQMLFFFNPNTLNNDWAIRLTILHNLSSLSNTEDNSSNMNSSMFLPSLWS
jgi:hypothetical protein